MKRLAVLSAATASLACAATASAYVSPDPFIEVSGNGLADGNFFSFAAVSPFDAHGAGHLLPPTGNIFVLGSDANGEHSFEGPVTCLTVDDLSGATTASVLFRITSKEREPAA